MFDVGFFELLMIGVVALVVIGPERLPRVAKTAGMWMGRAYWPPSDSYRADPHNETLVRPLVKSFYRVHL